MAEWKNLARSLALADGAIGEREYLIIRKELVADRNIEREELEFLLDLRKSARAVAPAFSQFINEIIKKSILKDGTLSAKEASWLRKWILADRKVSAEEKQLLADLKKAATQVSPEFQALYDECMGA